MAQLDGEDIAYLITLVKDQMTEGNTEQEQEALASLETTLTEMEREANPVGSSPLYGEAPKTREELDRMGKAALVELAHLLGVGDGADERSITELREGLWEKLNSQAPPAAYVPGTATITVEHDVGKGWEVLSETSGAVGAGALILAISRVLDVVGVHGSVRLTFQKLTDPQFAPQD